MADDPDSEGAFTRHFRPDDARRCHPWHDGREKESHEHLAVGPGAAFLSRVDRAGLGIAAWAGSGRRFAARPCQLLPSGGRAGRATALAMAIGARRHSPGRDAPARCALAIAGAWRRQPAQQGGWRRGAFKRRVAGVAAGRPPDGSAQRLNPAPQPGASAQCLNPVPQPSAKGSWRWRWPVSRASALAKAGASGGTPGSPMPLGGSALGTMCTATRGVSVMRGIGNWW